MASSFPPCRVFNLTSWLTAPLTRISSPMWYFKRLESSLALPSKQHKIFIILYLKINILQNNGYYCKYIYTHTYTHTHTCSGSIFTKNRTQRQPENLHFLKVISIDNLLVSSTTKCIFLQSLILLYLAKSGEVCEQNDTHHSWRVLTMLLISFLGMSRPMQKSTSSTWLRWSSLPWMMSV